MSKRRHNFGTKRFKEKSLFIFHARIALKSLILLFVRLIARGARIGKTHTQTHRHTDRHTDRKSTVTLAHARRGLIINAQRANVTGSMIWPIGARLCRTHLRSPGACILYPFQIRCNSRLNRFCKFWAGGRVVRISPGYASYVMRTLLRTPSGYSTFKFIPSTGCHMGLALAHSSTRCHRRLPTSPKHPCARTPTT